MAAWYLMWGPPLVFGPVTILIAFIVLLVTKARLKTRILVAVFVVFTVMGFILTPPSWTGPAAGWALFLYWLISDKIEKKKIKKPNKPLIH